MTDATATPESANLRLWLISIPYLGESFKLIVTFATGAGMLLLTQWATARPIEKPDKHQAKLEVPLVRLGDIEDVVRPLCGDLGKKLDNVTQLLSPQKTPTKPARLPSVPPQPAR